MFEYKLNYAFTPSLQGYYTAKKARSKQENSLIVNSFFQKGIQKTFRLP